MKIIRIQCAIAQKYCMDSRIIILKRKRKKYWYLTDWQKTCFKKTLDYFHWKKNSFFAIHLVKFHFFSISDDFHFLTLQGWNFEKFKFKINLSKKFDNLVFFAFSETCFFAYICQIKALNNNFPKNRKSTPSRCTGCRGADRNLQELVTSTVQNLPMHKCDGKSDTVINSTIAFLPGREYACTPIHTYIHTYIIQCRKSGL